MGRKLTKPRPKQGARLAQLRRAAGLSQYQLARIVSEPQANIAFWERSPKPPRSDALPKLAIALGVKIDDLIALGSARKLPKPKRGPVAKLRKLFDQIALLPRSQQDNFADLAALFLSHYKKSKNSRSSKLSLSSHSPDLDSSLKDDF